MQLINSYMFLPVFRGSIDVLLKSYGMAFSDKDDVLLIIKTFRNPHNKIEEQLSIHRAANPNYPGVSHFR